MPDIIKCFSTLRKEDCTTNFSLFETLLSDTGSYMDFVNSVIFIPESKWICFFFSIMGLNLFKSSFSNILEMTGYWEIGLYDIMKSIVNLIGSPNYQLGILKKFIGITSNVLSSSHFVSLLYNSLFKCPGKFRCLIRFCPVTVITELLAHNGLSTFWFSRSHWEMYNFSYFQYHEKISQHTFGTSMHSIFSPVVTDIFMESVEVVACKANCWSRYIDDKFIV